MQTKSLTRELGAEDLGQCGGCHGQFPPEGDPGRSGGLDMVDAIYLKSGVPIAFHFGEIIYDLQGKPVGQLRGSKIYCMAGHYIGELKNGVILCKNVTRGSVPACKNAINGARGKPGVRNHGAHRIGRNRRHNK